MYIEDNYEGQEDEDFNSEDNEQNLDTLLKEFDL